MKAPDAEIVLEIVRRTRLEQDLLITPTLLRQLAKIPQHELVRRRGISSGHMLQLMTGRRCAGPRIRQKLLNILGLTFDDLFVEVQ